MAVTVVIGGQFGSEGKGKVAQYLAAARGAAASVRVGGSNSGHTGFDAAGTCRVLRHLPTAAFLRDILCVIPAGAYVDLDVLRAEISATSIASDRLAIDPKAMLISTSDRDEERASGLRQRIGSTASGTGASVRRRIAREFGTRFAGDVEELTPYLADVTPQLRRLIDAGKRVIVEGTQGFGLSLIHSPHYPHVTSRDTSAAAAVAEAGLSPLDVDEVALVIRAYPIRVAGQSGPLREETTWDAVRRESGSDAVLDEYTSVTGALRRVGHFDGEIVSRAVAANHPSLIVLNHVDHVDAACAELGSLTVKARRFVAEVSAQIGRPINLVGVGPTALVSLERHMHVPALTGSSR